MMPISEPIKKSLEYTRMYDVLSVLEVGCGGGGILAQFPHPVKVGIDNFQPFLIAAAKDYGPEAIYIKYDVTKLWEIFNQGQFDAVIGFDILEHIPEVDMFNLIQTCENLARKLVIFFSPLDEKGVKAQPAPVEGNPGMTHITIIREKYFIERGYKTFTWPGYYKTHDATAMLAIKEL